MKPAPLSSIILPIALAAVLVWGVAPPVLSADIGGSKSQPNPMQTARNLINKGQYNAAIIKLGQIIQVNGYDADAHNLLGYAYRHDGRLEDAARSYEAALRLKPRHRGALEYQGELFLMLKAPDKAKANLAALAAICTSSCEEYEDLSEAIEAYQAGS